MVFRDLNERLVNAVRGDRQFEAALRFPRAADEDRADRIVDFEHLQVSQGARGAGRYCMNWKFQFSRALYNLVFTTDPKRQRVYNRVCRQEARRKGDH